MTLAENFEQPESEKTLSGQNELPSRRTIKFGFRQFLSNTFAARPNHQPTFLGHLLITSSLLIVISAGFVSLNWYAGNKANEWLGPKEQLTPIDEKLEATAAEKKRLAEQLNEIEVRINRHSAIMIFFYKRHYTAISLTSVSALVSGICLFFISKVGWEKVNNTLINVFVVTSSAAIFFGDLPGIFKQDENITANRELYLEHISLRNEVRSYIATGGTVGKDPKNPNLYQFTSTEPNRFIHYVDKRLAELNKISIGFDPKGITDLERRSKLGIPEKGLPQS
jgi:hypothetical protein